MAFGCVRFLKEECDGCGACETAPLHPAWDDWAAWNSWEEWDSAFRKDYRDEWEGKAVWIAGSKASTV